MQQIVVDGTVYVLAPEYRVVPLAPEAEEGGDVLHAFEDEGVAIVPAAASHGREVLDRPVYRLAPHGSLALPTARVFVRFADNDRAESHRAEIEAAGYRVDQIPSWAPHCAWVSHQSGGVRESLAGLERLPWLSGVRHIEPQLLLPRSPRAA